MDPDPTTESEATISPAPQESSVPPNVILEDSKTSSPAPQPLIDSKKGSEVPILPADVKASTVIGGSEFRVWVNDQITPYLLDGMRAIAKERPEEPLKFLGNYLLEKNEELKNGEKN